MTPGFLTLPSFLRENDYQDPTTLNQSSFNAAHKTDKTVFESLEGNPLAVTQFANHMSVYRRGRPCWVDPGFYPVHEQLVAGHDIEKHDVLLVDVGGSAGHDLTEFHQKWPTVPGRLILQDLPEVIDAVKQDLDKSIEPMAYNFFTEEPVKGILFPPILNYFTKYLYLMPSILGARAYYMHSVLHDWPDETCVQILTNLKAAMTPGYSKLLINENVVPDTGAHPETTGLDFNMMTIGSCERTRRHWIRLLETAGLKVLKVWTISRGVESLIECVLEN